MKNYIKELLQNFGIFASKALLVFILILATIGIGYSIVNNLQDDEVEPNTVRVNGIASVDAVPDEALIVMGIELTGDDPIELQNNVNPKVNSAVNQLKEFGIKEENITTSEYKLGTNTRNDDLLKISVVINVVVDDLVEKDTRVGEVIAIVFNNGFNRINTISYGFSDINQLREDLKNDAIENARDKKSELEDSLGLNLGDIVDVDLSNLYGFRRSYSIDDAYSVNVIENRQIEEPIEIQVGSETIREEVILEYEIL